MSAESSESYWRSFTGVCVDVLPLSLGVLFRTLMSSKLTVGVDSDCTATSSSTSCSLSLLDLGGS